MKKTKKSKLVKRKKKQSSNVSFVLEGKVFVQETKNGKIVSKEEIDGKSVLQCLVMHLENALNSRTDEDIKRILKSAK